ncbi:MAG: phosphoribosylglycinamide formyltransferase [Fusobacteriaceae bacterium]|jgi:phosphoribosylglycinamide formyltransferase-1|nr:phosphoribosylglycinamide formyltransferase [Fusobacteriaceae bacterium]
MFRLAVLVSGGGTNLQSVIDHVEAGELPCEIVAVIADRPCYGLVRAENHGIKGILLDRKLYKRGFFTEAERIFTEEKVDLVVLAGFLSILTPEFTEKWKNKIINIHPSLLPKFGGKGMYGLKVHEAVLAAGESESGCTVHYVDGGIDSGEAILRAKVPVLPGDTPEILQQRILVEEHKLLPAAIKKIITEEKS